MSRPVVRLDKESIHNLIDSCYEERDPCKRAECILNVAEILQKAAENTLSECKSFLYEVDGGIVA